ncbi:VOC family protein [Herbiconiux sp. P18]|uniref:VOC family protein n=1 Tax=Herbiconiux liangxiaofengii TaxID=3342795 RepID=UPI0035B82418
MRLDDVCIVNSDVTASDDFYRLDVGLERRMRNVRFADFVFDSGPRLAMWLRPSIAETVGDAYPTAAGLPFRVRIELRDAPDGERLATDPDGYVTELVAASGGVSRLSEVELAVSDVESTADFLARLGFERTVPGGSRFDGDGVTIILTPVASLTESPRAESFSRNGGHVMLAVELDSGARVDELYDELRSRGLEASGPPAVYEWGARSTYFVDPDGYIWEIYAWVETPR